MPSNSFSKSPGLAWFGFQVFCLVLAFADSSWLGLADMDLSLLTLLGLVWPGLFGLACVGSGRLGLACVGFGLVWVGWLAW